MKTTLILIVCTLLVVFTGCRKTLLDTKNENAYDALTYFKTKKEFNEAIIAGYAVLNHGGMMSREWYFNFDLMANDASPAFSLVGTELQLSNYSYTNANADIVMMWASLYRMIFRANLALEVMKKWTPATPAEEGLKKQYTAEAHWLRGFAYFYLVSCWGRVPVKLDFEASLRNSEPRVAVADVWKLVEDEFSAAIPDLPVNYAPGDLGRATKGAAIAYLGKAYLAQHKYAPAATQFEKLTKAPYSYSLDPDFDNLYSDNNINSPEVVFAVNHVFTTDNTTYYMFEGWEGDDGKTAHTGRSQEYGFNDWYNVDLSDALVAAFTYGNPALPGNPPYLDPRAPLTYYGSAGSGGDEEICDHCPGGPLEYTDQEIWHGLPAPLPNTWRKYEPYEFQQFTEAPRSGINTHVVRYADVKLMLAECYIEQNTKLPEAVGLINDVRNRPSIMAANYSTSLSQANARIALRRERQIELAGEQSRWFDLRRWGIAKATQNSERPPGAGQRAFEDKHLLLPIPLGEIQTNQALAGDIANDWN